MTLEDQDIRAIAFLACRIRKQTTGARQWHEDDVTAQLRKVQGRSLVSVMCATARCAADRNVNRPEAIASAGSHWADTMLVTDWVPNSVPREDRCSICSHSEEVCRMRFRGDHEFRSAAVAAKDAATPDPERTAAIRAGLQTTSGPTQRRSLDDLAEANPRLHENLERVRKMIPDAVTREPEPPPTPPMREADASEAEAVKS